MIFLKKNLKNSTNLNTVAKYYDARYTMVLIVLLILALLEIVLLNGAAAVRIHPPDEFSLAVNKNLSVLAYVEVFWWARVDVASRASKKAPQGLFCPPDYSAGRCCLNPRAQ